MRTCLIPYVFSPWSLSVKYRLHALCDICLFLISSYLRILLQHICFELDRFLEVSLYIFWVLCVPFNGSFIFIHCGTYVVPMTIRVLICNTLLWMFLITITPFTFFWLLRDLFTFIITSFYLCFLFYVSWVYLVHNSHDEVSKYYEI